MGNKPSLDAETVRMLEKGDVHLNEAKDPQVKRTSKKLETLKETVMAGGPPSEEDIRKLFDALAVDNKIDKAHFSILVRGSLNFAIKNAVCAALHGGQPGHAVALKKQAEEAKAVVAAQGGIGSNEKIAATAVIVKALDRLDFHSTKILDRVFDYLDADKNGSLDYDELKTFVTTIIANPMAAVDPMGLIGGRQGAESFSIQQVTELLSDIFTFTADVGIQAVDLVEETLCSPDVARALENDNMLWMQFFGLVGETDKITKKQFKAFLAQAPWEVINAQIGAQLGSPEMAVLLEHSAASFRELKEVVCQSISESGTAEEGMARAYAWLTGGVDEMTFMTNLLPPLRKWAETKMTPEEMKKQIKLVSAAQKAALAKTIETTTAQLDTQLAGLPEEQRDAIKAQVVGQLQAQIGMQNMIFDAMGNDANLDKVFGNPVVLDVIKKVQKVVLEKYPIVLHHLFRFCDINSDGGVSQKELNIIFAIKDAVLHGKIDEAAVHIFEVVDANGNDELSPAELVAFGTKIIHFYTAMLRLYMSVILETVLPEIVKAALPELYKFTGMDPEKVTKDNINALKMMFMGMVSGMMTGGGEGLPAPIQALMAPMMQQALQNQQ